MTPPKDDDLAFSGVCVVTGGTRGLGWMTASSFASRGAGVALCGRDAATVEAAAAALRADHGVDAYGAALDVRDRDATAAFAAGVRDRLGPPALVVSNAAVLGPVGALTDVDPESWWDALAIDLLGVANVLAVFGPLMGAAGGGAIVNLSGGGIGGPGVAPRISAYTASKAAVAVLTETAAIELAPVGVRVNAVAPGPQPTGFTEEILSTGPGAAGAELYASTVRNRAAAADAEGYLRLLRYLASDAGSWLTGRLLSARWETPESLIAARAEIEGSSRFQLRRIDENLYGELGRR